MYAVQERTLICMIDKISKKVMPSFEENIAYMDKLLPVKESFDIIRRDIVI